MRLKSDSNSKAKIGQRLFFDMHSDGTNAWTGKAASPGSSSVYSGKMSIARSTLNTSGCIVGGLICKSANWTKLQ
jgi:uncharacterized protein (DUF2147 family)